MSTKLPNIQIVRPHLADAGLQAECDDLRSRLREELYARLKTSQEAIGLSKQLRAEKVAHGETMRRFWRYRCNAKRHFIAIYLVGIAVGGLLGCVYGLSESRASLIEQRNRAVDSIAPDRPPVENPI